MDTKVAAQNIRARLEKRLAKFLCCEVGELPPLRLGELVNTCFLLWGDSEELGGFNPTMQSLSQILTRDVCGRCRKRRTEWKRERRWRFRRWS
jgi:hypothetical protein